MVDTGITITLGRPDLDAEERKQRALRAQEVLGAAAWLFDEVVSDLTRDLVGSDPAQSGHREDLHRQIAATMHLKGHLLKILEIQQAEEKVHERKHRSKPLADHE